MSDAAKLIVELARHVERGEELDSSELVEIYARIEHLKAEFGKKGQRAAKDADSLLEKLLLQCVGNRSAALGDLGHVLATADKSPTQR